MENYENNYEGYEHLKLYSDESQVVTLIKGLLGAVVGAIPGFLIWLLLARLGYVSVYCGFLIAIGSIVAYSFMTKKGELSPAIGFIVCTAVLAAAVILAVRIDWAWEFTKFFEETVYPEYRLSMMDYGFTSAEIQELYEESMMEEFGFVEASFGDCFKNLKVLVEYADSKSDYIFDYVLSGICGIAGAAATYAKFLKK